MQRAVLLERVQKILSEHGWVNCNWHGCFDIAARKERTVLIKILENVDSLQESTARELRLVAQNLDAAVLLIGENTNRERLRDGVVYERLELPTISLKSFEQIICEGILPTIYRDRGGLYVKIDSTLLRNVRRGSGLTQRELAEAVGISPKAVWEHEQRELRMTLKIAAGLEQILKKKLSEPIDLLSAGTTEKQKTVPKDRLEREVGRDLSALGFHTDYIRRAPFDILAREKALIVSDVESNRRKLMKRGVSLRSFIATVKRPALVITENIKESELFGIPVLKRKELHEFDKAKQLLKVARKAE
jgi:putative transcriptional regulator